MHNHFSLFVKIAFGLCLFFACARPIAPSGGGKDELPPAIDTARSTANFQVNFKKQPIKLTFDEWVVLKDVGQQVLISPPLGRSFNPSRDIKLKGRTVTLDLDESIQLRDSTTYTINFGNSIQDLTEGNPAKDMRFVFSTGAFLDSLKFSGQVVDAFTGEGVEKVTVMLYEENEADSVVTNGLPYYFTMSDAGGNFELQNLSSKTYRVVAVEENFANQRWDANERIAFLDKNITLPDSNRTRPKLRLFGEQGTLRKTGQSNLNYGLAMFAYNAAPDSLLPPRSLQNVPLLHVVSNDTVYIWYKNQPDSTWQLVLGADTLDVRTTWDSLFFAENALDFAKPIAASGKRLPSRGKKTDSPPKPVRVVPTKSIQATDIGQISFGRPLEAVDSALCFMVLDSTETAKPLLGIDSRDQRILTLSFPWKGAKTYTLNLLPGAITDWYGQKNQDTLAVRFSIIDPEQLSNLEVTLTPCVKGMEYWVELTTDGKNIVRSAAVTAQDSSAVLSFLSLPVSPYTVRVIEDKNGNHRWDAGSFEAKRQPERVFTQKVESLKPNWSVKAEITLEEGVSRLSKAKKGKQ